MLVLTGESSQGDQYIKQVEKDRVLTGWGLQHYLSIAKRRGLHLQSCPPREREREVYRYRTRNVQYKESQTDARIHWPTSCPIIPIIYFSHRLPLHFFLTPHTLTLTLTQNHQPTPDHKEYPHITSHHITNPLSKIIFTLTSLFIAYLPACLLTC